jgi:hypothetical protein
MKRRLTREETLRIKELLESLTKPTNPTCPHNPNLDEYTKIMNAIYDIIGIKRIEEHKRIEYNIIDMRDKSINDILGGMK